MTRKYEIRPMKIFKDDKEFTKILKFEKYLKEYLKLNTLEKTSLGWETSNQITRKIIEKYKEAFQ